MIKFTFQPFEQHGRDINTFHLVVKLFNRFLFLSFVVDDQEFEGKVDDLREHDFEGHPEEHIFKVLQQNYRRLEYCFPTILNISVILDI